MGARCLLRLVVLVIVAVAGYFAPLWLRALLETIACLVVPMAAWSQLARQRVTDNVVLAGALGLLATLAGWAVVEFVLLLARGAVNIATSTVAVAALCALPFALNDPIAWRPRLPRRAVVAWTGVLVSSGAGLGLLALTMRVARSNPGSQAAFAVFWLSMLVLLVPLFLAVAAGTRRAGLVTVGFAVATYLPLYVRAPFAPYLNDEIGHWGEAVRMLQTGRLFQPDSVVPVGPKYPGLQTMTVGIAELTGLPVIDNGRLLILLCHVLSALGILMIAKRVGASDRGALFAVALYGISPSFIHIDTMYSYESLGIPLAIWIVVLTLHHPRPSQRPTWLAVSVLTGFALIITHHLTCFAAAGLLLVIALARAIRRERDWRVAAGVGAALLVAALVWSYLVDANLGKYLGVFPQFAWQGVAEFLGLASKNSDAGSAVAGGGGQDAFATSALPQYETLLGVVAQPVLLVWCLYALWTLGRRITGAQIAFGVLALLYFVSLPLVFISGASAGAHRSWAVSSIGVAVLISLAAGRPAPRAAWRGRLSAPTRVAATCAALIVITVANFSAASNEFERLPGPYRLGADGRTVTPDMIRSARWLLHTQGANARIATNTRTVTVFGAYGFAQAPRFPTSDLVFPPRSVPPDVRDEFLASNIDYLVIDDRLATDVPRDSYFGAYQADPPSIPLPESSLTKFDHVDWLREIHHDGHMTIYRVVRSSD